MHEPNKDPQTALADFLRKVGEGEENVLEIIHDVDGDDPQGKKTVVALQRRKLQPEPPLAPEKAESPRRAHIFNDAQGFVDYLDKYKGPDTVILANVAANTITATLDEKAANGFEMICLCPAVHPLFAPWKQLLAASVEGTHLTVGNFAEFILANRRAVTAPEVRDLIQTLGQVRASKHVTLERGTGNRSLNGLMVETIIQSKASTEPVDLPDAISINVPLFVGTSPRQIDIDLLATAGESQIFMRAVSADVAMATIEAFEEMLQECRALEGVVVAMGRPDTDPWEYID